MKFPNYLISSLAIVGACSLIIMACSADNSNNNNNLPNTTNAAGKYQLSGDGSTEFIHVINTETRIVKTYKNTLTGGMTGNYTLYATTTTNP